MTILGNNVWQMMLFIELNGSITREIQIRGGEVAKEEQEWFKGVETRYRDNRESAGGE